ncbi:replication initiation factor domain-containing protein [Bacillus safensis]|uniref:replication initiation factor domain-containing protein n=1 Tax=Bacillus safensis TaxID=561879 RepID=UPI002E1BCDA9|nr:replication initiation factor domain-containing protein [Bacillus safensis]
MNVITIYNQLSKKNQIVKTITGRRNYSVLSAITKNNITSTFYLDSKGKNIKALLRVYNKKKEQVETMGVRYDEAIHYDDWVRFEAVYKGAYAHDLSDRLKGINNDTELKDLLVSALTDRYQFIMPNQKN